MNSENKELEIIKIDSPFTVKDFASALSKTPAEIVAKLMEDGVMLTINEVIDEEIAQIIAEEFGYKLNISQRNPDADEKSCKDRLCELVELDDPKKQKPRPAIVTIMGHVDHGKTKLLDAIRTTDVVSGEAGGITQHIGAYQIDKKGKKITFLDTPGHEAFAAMRARGAEVTDIVVLVVAANDGVKPQTKEAIGHAKVAKVPIIVAINKIDLPDADINRTKKELAEAGILTEGYGGDIVTVEVSAKQGTNIDQLLEMIVLVADMQEYKADPTREAVGPVIESRKGIEGPVATVLIKTGTLHKGDAIVAGTACGIVRRMEDWTKKEVLEASPAMPVRVIGFDIVPEVGDILEVKKDKKAARIIANHRIATERLKKLKGVGEFGLVEMARAIKHGKLKKLNVVLKADVEGSLEAVAASLEKLKNNEVMVQVLMKSVGIISKSDVMMAKASKAIVIGFNISIPAEAAEVAKREGVEIKTYKIIYELIDELKAALEGMLAPEIIEESLAKIKVLAVFKTTKKEMIFGGRVIEGKAMRGEGVFVKLTRDKKEISRGKLMELQAEKENCAEVIKGKEAGMRVEGIEGVKEGDVVEMFTISEKARKI